MISIGELLKIGKKRLKTYKKGQPDIGDIEAETLLAYLLNRERFDLYLDHDLIVSPDKIARYQKWIDQRKEGIPVQYITGFQNFMGLEFKVRQGVFIPRPETEILVEKVISLIESLNHKDELFLLDLGIGSGIIPVTICHYFLKKNRMIQFYGTDILPEAIKLAKENAKKHHCGNHIHFFQGNLFQPLAKLTQKIYFDSIVSNPPYIPLDQWTALPDEVSCYEPHKALYGGKDGLDIYRKIIRQSPKFLKKGNSFLALEIGHKQKKDILDLFDQNHFYKKDIISFKDYYHQDRGMIAFSATR